MSEAVFVQKGAAIDYTPASADVEAGDIVFLANNYAGVAEFPIAQNAMGSLAVTGIFKCAKDENAITAGALVYWNTDKAQAGAVSNKYLGRAAIAAADSDSYIYFFLNAPNIGAFTAIDPQASPVATQSTVGDLAATDPTCDAADPTITATDPTCDAADPSITAVDPAAITAADPTVVDPVTEGIDGAEWAAADSVVKAAIEANTTAVKAVEAELEKLIDDVTSIHTQLKAAIADLATLRDSDKAIIDDVQAIETSLELAIDDLATLRDSDKAIIDDVQAIETSLEAGIDDIGTLKTAANAAKTDLAAVVTALETAGALT